ncbi:MAG: LUD domain-containing protein [Lewinellaceae bacterium]|nr:LUD domain-containing protein [Saprospiraceae bacterium]MCB9329668.1 LUD domain-containing protein [Lewinellaceae bacterium]
MGKDSILQAIRQNKPAGRPLPEIPIFPGREITPTEQFIKMAETGGSQILRAAHVQEINAMLKNLFPEARNIASPVPEITSTINLEEIQSPLELEQVDVAVIRGHLGVAENGAVWLTESACRHRILPFITQHLMLLIPETSIVPTLHDAYRNIRINDEGFGIFIAGPSKTADIEQALVIGAQGARSLTIILTAF